MVDEKNHLFGPLDMLRDSKLVNKRKTQQQYSRFSISLATSVNNSSIQSNSPALQTNSKPQIGLPYDDTKGAVASNQSVSFEVFGSQYTFFEVTGDVAFTFTGLPSGRFIEFILDIEVNQPAGVNLSFPQVINPPVLSGVNGERNILKFVGVRRSDPTGVNPPVDTYTFLAGTTTSTGGSQQLHLDLGNVSGLVDIDWSAATLFTMVMTGDTTVNFINLPTSPNWEDICVQVQQDNVGNHSFLFQQVMANGFIPMALTGANRFTSFQVYSYQLPVGTNIFQAFDKSGGTGPTVPGSGGTFNGFAGYIQSVLSVNQTTNLIVGAHIEFDTIVKAEGLTVSGVGGQSSGVFSGFTPGHLYECEVYLAAEGSTNNLIFTAQWFSSSLGALIGTEGLTLAETGASNKDSQQVAKAFFLSSGAFEQLTVQITDNVSLTAITNGIIASDGTCMVTIKDCGIPESVINQPFPAPEDISLDIREMTYLSVAVNSASTRFGNWQGNLGSNSTPSDQDVSQAGVIKELSINVSQKGAGIISFQFRKNGAVFGPIFQLPASTTGFFEFLNLNLPWNSGDSIGWQTTGGVGGQPAGDQWNMTIIYGWS